MFQETYLAEDALKLEEYRILPDREGRIMSATLRAHGKQTVIEGKGNGPIDAFVDGLKSAGIAAIEVLDASRATALTGGANA